MQSSYAKALEAARAALATLRDEADATHAHLMEDYIPREACDRKIMRETARVAHEALATLAGTQCQHREEPPLQIDGAWARDGFHALYQLADRMLDRLKDPAYDPREDLYTLRKESSMQAQLVELMGDDHKAALDDGLPF